MTTAHCHETNLNEDYGLSRDDRRQRYPSTNSSTPNSSGGDKQFNFTNYNNERSGQNSRTSSLAESTSAAIHNEGFSNYADLIQHLQTVWFDNNTTDDSGGGGSRRTTNNPSVTSNNNPNANETIVPHHSKGPSQTLSSSQPHYSHHQYSGQPHWNNYNNPRRSGGNGHYNRNYNGAPHDVYWNPKSNRFPSHRSMNNLMHNAGNYQQQSQASPPTQRRQGEQQYYHNDQQQSYYKKNRSNGYHNYQHQQTSDYSSNSSAQSNSTSEQSSISSTQSYPSHLNSYNR